MERKLWLPFIYSAPPNGSRYTIHNWSSLDRLLVVELHNGAQCPVPTV